MHDVWLPKQPKVPTKGSKYKVWGPWCTDSLLTHLVEFTLKDFHGKTRILLIKFLIFSKKMGKMKLWITKWGFKIKNVKLKCGLPRCRPRHTDWTASVNVQPVPHYSEVLHTYMPLWSRQAVSNVHFDVWSLLMHERMYGLVKNECIINFCLN